MPVVQDVCHTNRCAAGADRYPVQLEAAADQPIHLGGIERGSRSVSTGAGARLAWRALSDLGSVHGRGPAERRADSTRNAESGELGFVLDAISRPLHPVAGAALVSRGDPISRRVVRLSAVP